MENQNIIIFLDKIKKLIELGNTPTAISEIDTIIVQLDHSVRKKQGKIIILLPIVTIGEISQSKQFALDNRKKLNEIIQFINNRNSDYLTAGYHPVIINEEWCQSQDIPFAVYAKCVLFNISQLLMTQRSNR